MARLGVDRLVISKVLNHAEGGVTKRYDHHRYDAEKRAALDRWALHLQAVVYCGGGEMLSSSRQRGDREERQGRRNSADLRFRVRRQAICAGREWGSS